MKIYTLIFFLNVFYLNTFAQSNFTLTGVILNENSEPVVAATVFIDGSKKVITTDTKGKYSFTGLGNGGYNLVVNMVGYGSIKQDVLIQDKSLILNIKLFTKQTTLKEVVIIGSNQRRRYVDIFKKYFLGESENASGCTILNSDILNFDFKGQILSASSEDFLLIENRALGYRIKYFLRDFRYNEYLDATQYYGQFIFEELGGSAVEMANWHKSRRKAYYGSLMHYLRSLYLGSTQKEGFVTYKVLNDWLPIDIDSHPMKNSELLKRIDSNFIELKYKRRLYTVYDIDMASNNYSFKKKERIVKDLHDQGSIFKTDGKIDAKGNYINYKELLIQGYWGRKRIGDQLPYEYVPN